jgi:hypothetical protein
LRRAASTCSASWRRPRSTAWSTMRPRRGANPSPP